MDNKIKKIFTANKIDSFYINKPEDIFWITGFWSEDARLLATKNNLRMFTSPLDIESCKKTINKSIKVGELNTLNLEKAANNLRIIGFDKNCLTISQLETLKKVCKKSKLKGFADTLKELRTQKSQEEINKIKKSASIADKALKKAVKLFKTGITEKELAWKLEQMGRDMRAESVSFDFIVAFGANSAIPHHKTGHKKLTKNTPVLLDFGFKYQKYCSDLSRSFFFGKPTNKWLKTYEVVKEAQKKAINTIKIGTNLKDAHNTAVGVFKENNIDKNFIHGLGHGVGLEIHELPNISPKSKGEFEENMVFTVEPGIYFKDEFGIRIEDVCTLGKSGVNVISKASYKFS